MRSIFISAGVCCLLFSGIHAETEWQYKGKIELGAGYLSRQDSESTSDAESISTLTRQADTESGAMPMLGYSLQAISPSRHYRYFLQDKQYTGIETGVAYQDVSGLYTFALNMPLFAKETWKNPYETTSRRESTSVDSYGASAGYKYQLDPTRFIELGYTFEQNDISEDELLAVSEDLARDSMVHEAKLNMGVGDFMIGVSYAYGDAEGKVYTYDEPGMNLGIGGMFSPQWFGLLNAFASVRQYHKENPYFNEKREDTTYGMMGTVRYLKPFGWERSYGFFNTLYKQTQSNITFFDKELMAAGVGMGYRF